MMNLVRKNLLLIVTTVAGIAAGLLYWKYVGCLTGSCPIKSKWYLSSLYGGLLGYLAGSLLNDIILRIRKKREITN